MASEFESGMFYKEPAWHKLGVVLDNPTTSEDAIREAGLDWEVIKSPLAAAYVDPNDYENRIYPIEVPDTFAMIRDKDRSVLGVVGDRYQPVQNSDAFRFIDSALGEGITYESAGSLRGGKIVWAMAKAFDEYDVKGGDMVRQFLLFAHGHDGTMPVSIALTPVRVVCANTLTLALSKNVSKMIKVRHTRSMNKRMVQVNEFLTGVSGQFLQIGQSFTKMADYPLTIQQASDFIDTLLNKTEEEEGDKEEMSTRSKNKRNLILDLWKEQALGGQYVSAKGTLWGLLNGVTEAVDHHLSLSSRGVAEDASMRLSYSWFGAGSRTKIKAFSMAQELVKDRGRSLISVE